jgi:hypothetical protein
LYVSEYIAADRQAFIGLEFFHYLADESVMVAVFLYADYLVAASGHKLDADAACAGK